MPWHAGAAQAPSSAASSKERKNGRMEKMNERKKEIERARSIKAHTSSCPCPPPHSGCPPAPPPSRWPRGRARCPGRVPRGGGGPRDQRGGKGAAQARARARARARAHMSITRTPVPLSACIGGGAWVRQAASPSAEAPPSPQSRPRSSSARSRAGPTWWPRLQSKEGLVPGQAALAEERRRPAGRVWASSCSPPPLPQEGPPLLA